VGFKLKASPSRLCAASYEKFDITINGKKIGGNAQKRRRDVIFQHGSIPIDMDFNLMRKYLRYFSESVASGVTFLAKELKGNLDKDAIEEKLIESFKKTFNVEFIKDESLNETVLVR
jgi:lipoyl(octanoyl) transferase